MARKKEEQPEPTILVVDDNPVNVRLLTGMLKKSGFKTRAAQDGKSALQAAENNPPDLVLLDINMPEMNGYEVSERLKGMSGLADIPVIFMSGLDEVEDKAMAFRAGGVDYVSTPFQPEEVEARVKTHLELRARRREVERGHEQLRDAESLRDNLVHMLAHDLRNSLTAVSGYLDLIALTGKQVLSEKTMGYVHKGTQSVLSTVAMLSTMLDVSRMEAGTMRLSLITFDVSPLAATVLAEMEVLRGGKELVLDPPATEAYITADRDVVRRVIQNLVGNALKSVSSDGWVRLGIAPGDDWVRLTLKDNGPCIAEGDREKIFEKFGQADKGSGQTSYSSGLGLTFCKLAVEAHGGAIGVESGPDGGNTYWFDLPVNPPKR